jgi:hypothetical protein
MKSASSKKGHSWCKNGYIIVCFVGVVSVIVVWVATLEILMEESAVIEPGLGIRNEFELNNEPNRVNTLSGILEKTSALVQETSPQV